MNHAERSPLRASTRPTLDPRNPQMPNGAPYNAGKGRKGQGAGKDPWSLTAPLTKERFKKELRAATRMQFRPIKRELQKQVRISKLQQQLTGDYYKDYQQKIRAIQGQTAAAYQGAGAALGSYAAQAGSGDAALRAKLDAAAAQSAQLRGGVDSGVGSATSLAGSANRAFAGGDMAGAIAAQGANQQAFLADKRVSAESAKIAAKLAEARNRRDLSDDKLEVLREQGDFKQNYRAEAREGERRYQLALKELRASRKAREDEQAHASSEAAKDRRLARSQASGGSESSDGPKNKGKNKAESRREYQKAYRDAWAMLKSSPPPDVLTTGKGKNKEEHLVTANDIAAILIQADVPPRVARAAAKEWIKKHPPKGGGGVGGGLGGGLG